MPIKEKEVRLVAPVYMHDTYLPKESVLWDGGSHCSNPLQKVHLFRSCKPCVIPTPSAPCFGRRSRDDDCTKPFFSFPLEQGAVSLLQLKYIFFLRERSRRLQLTGLDWKCFLCPAKNVSVMEYCGGKRVTLAYLENEPEKISERQSKE